MKSRECYDILVGNYCFHNSIREHWGGGLSVEMAINESKWDKVSSWNRIVRKYRGDDE